jgi:UDP-N-acetylmuramate dehydrogenase
MNLPRSLRKIKASIQLEEPLSRHTTFKIGGPVKFWATPHNNAALKQLLSFASLQGLPILVVGLGSNLVVTDSFIKALAINLNSPEFLKLRIKSNVVSAGAGVALTHLIKYCLAAEKGGIEFLAGIPGTVGGAIWTNAAALSANSMQSMADIVKEITLMTGDGKICSLKREQLRFDYRKSSLSQCIILQAQLNVRPKPGKKIKDELNANMLRRLESQELNIPSAGCIFKNPSQKVSAGMTAGYLIDKAGLKGVRVGSAQVSSRHANFIINTGQAKASQVLRLIALVQAKVKRKFDIELEPEVKIIRNIKRLKPSKKVLFL